METREWTFVDKSLWGTGPWSSEPDKLQWEDPQTGMPCLAVRSFQGNWCGYVGVEPGHPFYGIPYAACARRPIPCVGDDCSHTPEDLFDVHCGVNYSRACTDNPEGICHVPSPGEPEHLWWFGFDCGHAFDISPVLNAQLRAMGSHPFDVPEMTYKSLEYVRTECRRLALQLDDRDWKERLAALPV